MNAPVQAAGESGVQCFSGEFSGLRKTSFVDYPGKLAAVLFFPGCNLRCPWCHNGELAAGGGRDTVRLDEAVESVIRRREVLSAVVLSGGEPTLRDFLPLLIKIFKDTGFLVKLDTNGLEPSMLEKIFSKPKTSPDYIALDLKLSPSRYSFLSAAPGAAEKLAESARLIARSGKDHEYRSLALPGNFFTSGDVEALAPLVDNSPWYFTAFRPGTCLDPAWNAYEESGREQSESLAEAARKLGKRAFTDRRPVE